MLLHSCNQNSICLILLPNEQPQLEWLKTMIFLHFARYSVD